MNSNADNTIFILGLILIWIVVPTATIFIRRILKNDLIKIKIMKRKESKRSCIVEATVTKVENMIWKYSQVEDASLECEYIDQKGKVRVFKVSGIIGKFNVKVGDTVLVMVQPNKWSNYQILLNDIVD